MITDAQRREGDKFEALLHELDQFTKEYKVPPDDVLHAVARKFDITINELQWDVETEKKWPAFNDIET